MKPRKNRFLNPPKYRTVEAPVISGHCPMVRYRAAWCRGLCEPSGGIGSCGRLAPHSMLGRTQKAILAHKKRKSKAETEAKAG